jgi:hypothetical protein
MKKFVFVDLVIAALEFSAHSGRLYDSNPRLSVNQAALQIYRRNYFLVFLTITASYLVSCPPVASADYSLCLSRWMSILGLGTSTIIVLGLAIGWPELLPIGVPFAVAARESRERAVTPRPRSTISPALRSRRSSIHHAPRARATGRLGRNSITLVRLCAMQRGKIRSANNSIA